MLDWRVLRIVYDEVAPRYCEERFNRPLTLFAFTSFQIRKEDGIISFSVMNSGFDSHRRRLVSVLVGTSIFWVFFFCSTIAQAQQLGPNKAKVAIVPFFSVGLTFGDLQESQSIEEHLEYGSHLRNWQFHPGYTFTARFLLWQSQFVGGENSGLVTIGLLSGCDLSLLPMRPDKITSADGTYRGDLDDKLIENNVYLTPGFVIRPNIIPVQLLLMAGVNYRSWNGSNLSGIDLENSFGISWMAMIRYHSIWGGITVHKGRFRFRKSMFWPLGYEASVDISRTTVTLSIGFNGWHP